MKRVACFALPCAVVLVAGCNPTAYESAPVEVTTDLGVVTCQLYTDDILLWDRSIGRPNAMTVRRADEICEEEGRRRAGR